MVWNSLPRELRDPACGFDSFKQFLKTILLVSTNATSTLEVFLNDMHYINSRFTYLLTYVLRRVYVQVKMKEDELQQVKSGHVSLQQQHVELIAKVCCL